MFSKHTFGARNYGPGGLLPCAAKRSAARRSRPLSPQEDKARLGVLLAKSLKKDRERIQERRNKRLNAKRQRIAILNHGAAGLEAGVAAAPAAAAVF